MLRNFNLGADRRDVVLFVVGTILALGLTVFWDQILVAPITASFPNNAQVVSKYVLCLIILLLAGVISVLSLISSRRSTRDGGPRQPVAGLMIRFGLALQIFGILITPIGLFYATNPTRSVPVGFTAFTAVFLGLFIAGIGGNLVAPRRL